MLLKYTISVLNYMEYNIKYNFLILIQQYAKIIKILYLIDKKGNINLKYYKIIFLIFFYTKEQRKTVIVFKENFIFENIYFF